MKKSAQLSRDGSEGYTGTSGSAGALLQVYVISVPGRSRDMRIPDGPFTTVQGLQTNLEVLMKDVKMREPFSQEPEGGETSTGRMPHALNII